MRVGDIMERLTKRKQNREPYIDCNKMCADWHKCDRYKCRQIEIVDKLAEYEDLEEQDLLLKLPCKVGDEVWRILTQHDNYDDSPYKIVTRTTFRLDMLDCIGKTVFLTKAEAETALEERCGVVK